MVTLEAVLRHLEHLLAAGRFAAVDEWVASCPVSDPLVVLGVLSITSAARDRLAKREDFLTRAEPFLVRTLGAERTAKLLENRR